MADLLLRRQGSCSFEADKNRLLLTASLIKGSALRDDCRTRHAELRRVIDKADEAWKSLETQLEQIEESIQKKVCQHLNLGKSDPDTAVAEDGARSLVRDRLRRLLVVPLRQSMEQWVGVVARQDQDCSDARERNLMADLSGFCDETFDCIEEAAVADKNLDKTIRKTERDERAKGIVSLGMKDTKAVAALKLRRPGIWEVARRKLDELSLPAKRVDEFVQKEMTAEQIACRLAQAPAIVVRAFGDWHFERCTKELDQLQSWWGTTKGALAGNDKLWDALQSKEGLFIQRIEKGLDDVCSRKQRYAAYATFGTKVVSQSSGRHLQRAMSSAKDLFWTPALESSLTLVGIVLADMRKGLGSIRNSAMWRVVEAGRQIQKELEEPALWDTVTVAEGARALLARVDAAAVWPERQDVNVPPDEDFLEEMLLIAIRRLDCLIKVSTEVRDFFDKDGLDPRADVYQCGDTVARLLADMSEELLAALDDPSVTSVQEWLELWSQWDGATLAEDLEKSFKATPPRKFHGETARLQHKQLAQLRGLQTLAQTGQELRMKIVSAMKADVVGLPRSPAGKKDFIPLDLRLQKVQDMAAADALLSEPPSVTASRPVTPVSPSAFGCSIPDSMRREPVAVASPQQSSTAKRRSLGNAAEASVADFHGQPEQLVRSPSNWMRTSGDSKLFKASRPASRGSRTAAAASVPFQSEEDLWNVCNPVSPVAYSQKMLGQSASQPTFRASRGMVAARDRDRNDPLVGVVRAPTMKFIDGERIPLRPDSAQTRLAPLPLRGGSAARRAPSLAWG